MMTMSENILHLCRMPRVSVSSKKSYGFKIVGVVLFLAIVGGAIAYLVMSTKKQTKPSPSSGVAAGAAPTQEPVVTPAQCTPHVIREREVVYKDTPPPQYNKRGPYQNDAADYKQIGLLVSNDMGEPPVMLPLFGRKIVGRDRYEYYTATDKIHLWKVSVEYEHRDCQDQLGCNQIYDGVDVVVPDYSNKTFKARIYKNVNIHDRIDVC
jgi:Family of unknown function (DUF5755)